MGAKRIFGMSRPLAYVELELLQRKLPNAPQELPLLSWRQGVQRNMALFTLSHYPVVIGANLYKTAQGTHGEKIREATE